MLQEDRILQRLLKKYPSDDEGHLGALAEVWSIERDRIIVRMLELDFRQNLASY